MKTKTSKIIDKHLSDFYKLHKITVPIELLPYIYKIIHEVKQAG